MNAPTPVVDREYLSLVRRTAVVRTALRALIDRWDEHHNPPCECGDNDQPRPCAPCVAREVLGQKR